MNRLVEETIEHLSFLARHFSEQDVKSVVTVFLLELNIPPHYDGFGYLEYAITFNRDKLRPDTSSIYDAIAEQYDWQVDSTQVENAIRGAIKAAWECRDADVWRHYFLDIKRKADRRPTNTEFISMLAQILKLWKGCCKAQSRQEVHV